MAGVSGRADVSCEKSLRCYNNISVTEDEVHEILYNDDSGDELIPCDSESDGENASDDEEIVCVVNSDDPDSPFFRPKIPDFTAHSGITDIANRPISDDMFFVNMFIDNDFFEFLCDQTNLYAIQGILAAPRPFTRYSLYQTWTPVSVKEMKKFLGLILITGIIKSIP
ncbi:hypothetical protein C0J52_08146 [Blattella germanica]|nr:hypothetical protein C0J52_08146 [Blattella germanica]